MDNLRRFEKQLDTELRGLATARKLMQRLEGGDPGVELLVDPTMHVRLATDLTITGITKSDASEETFARYIGLRIATIDGTPVSTKEDVRQAIKPMKPAVLGCY
ncbi:hypothetical protein DIPPA_09476 [Diplonema papillatum]|nr:hypothetical protein DIPPA_09476 [Diplonema papillatum]